LPAALAARGAAMARGYVDSLVLGAGQFCTNPGLLIALDGEPLGQFIEAAKAAVAEKPSQTMLTAGIQTAYQEGVARLSKEAGAAAAQGVAASGPVQARPALFVVDAPTFLSKPGLHSEVFGPVSIVIRCANEAQMLSVAEHLEGQLTATLQLDAQDTALARSLLPILERKVGRILANGYPTGVEVCHAMVHGGPFPATSDSRVTSVGSTSIERFLRPVCYQDLPAALLPEALQDGNPFGVWRLVDGQLGHA
jgi:2,5-dioxopentanoate dehydrogenase